MSYKFQHQSFFIQLKRGLRASLDKKTTLHVQGELLSTTDTHNLFLSDGSALYPVQTADMLVCHEDDLVFHNGEPVIVF